MTLRWHGYVALALVTTFGAIPAAQAQKMYWSDFGGIVRANLDGSDVEVVVSDVFGVLGIALDPVRRKIYWTSVGSDTIQRANLDGSQIESLITTGLDRPWGIALDVARGKMYWANRRGGTIQRANLDGTGVKDVVVTGSGPTAIGLDLQAGKLYWANSFFGRISRSNLDGTEVEDSIIDVPLAILSFALDLNSHKIYYTVADSTFFFLPGRIQRANLDGSGVEDLIMTGSFTQPSGIALDVPAGKMYWTDTQVRKIQRANLDGSDLEDLIAGGSVGALALDLAQAVAIPTLSVWGLVVMALLIVTMGRMFSLRRLRSVKAR